MLGGNGWEFRSEDKMTGAKRFRFELRSGNDPREESDYEPRVELFCSGGKFQRADFDPGAGLGPPNRPGFWGQPQMEVMVRIDDAHEHHGWNWVAWPDPSRWTKAQFGGPDWGQVFQNAGRNRERFTDCRVLTSRAEAGSREAGLWADP